MNTHIHLDEGQVEQIRELVERPVAFLRAKWCKERELAELVARISDRHPVWARLEAARLEQLKEHPDKTAKQLECQQLLDELDAASIKVSTIAAAIGAATGHLRGALRSGHVSNERLAGIRGLMANILAARKEVA